MHPFRLGEWWVEPSLNRLSRPSQLTRGEAQGATSGRVLRLEPKMMDVLVALAQRAGEVVTKAELEAAVWPGRFISDSVLTRAVAGLRRAFDDDSQAPRFVETIAKRGYRLLVAPVSDTAGTDRASERTRHSTPAASSRPNAPGPAFTVGQWVRGERFYGRDALLDEILAGARDGLWLLGARASGKTSTLRQLEWLVTEGGRDGWLPIYWDLQGAATPEALDEGFTEAVEEVWPRFAAAGLSSDILKNDDGRAGDFCGAIQRLRRALRPSGMRLLLLLDEAEELLAIAESWPALVRKLRRTLLSQEGARTVLAAGPRLWRLGEPGDDTSPFLHGFAPPLVLGGLDNEAARRLLSRGSTATAPDAVDALDALDALVTASGGHPYLLQLLGSRWLEKKHGKEDLEAALASIDADPSLNALFAVDHELFGAETPLPNPFWSRWLARRGATGT